jgi:hypothetical protein
MLRLGFSQPITFIATLYRSDGDTLSYPTTVAAVCDNPSSCCLAITDLYLTSRRAFTCFITRFERWCPRSSSPRNARIRTSWLDLVQQLSISCEAWSWSPARSSIRPRRVLLCTPSGTPTCSALSSPQTLLKTRSGNHHASGWDWPDGRSVLLGMVRNQGLGCATPRLMLYLAPRRDSLPRRNPP